MCGWGPSVPSERYGIAWDSRAAGQGCHVAPLGARASTATTSAAALRRRRLPSVSREPEDDFTRRRARGGRASCACPTPRAFRVITDLARAWRGSFRKVLAITGLSARPPRRTCSAVLSAAGNDGRPKATRTMARRARHPLRAGRPHADARLRRRRDGDGLPSARCLLRSLRQAPCGARHQRRRKPHRALWAAATASPMPRPRPLPPCRPPASPSSTRATTARELVDYGEVRASTAPASIPSTGRGKPRFLP